MSKTGQWSIHRRTLAGDNQRFPFQITVASDEGGQMRFQCRELWPPTGGNLFVVKLPSDAPIENGLELVETLRVLDVRVERTDKATTIGLVLDRRMRKRCSFLIVKKEGKEIVYLRTESGIRAHRSHSYVQPTTTRIGAEVVIDSREKYPWAFDAVSITKEALPAGDYALRIDGQLKAIIERKSFTNMLVNLNSLEAYQVHLQELSAFPHATLLVEADLRDFGNPKKTRPMAAARCQRALSALAAAHPNLQVIFAGTRKEANVWASMLFSAIEARGNGGNDTVVQEDLLVEDGHAHQATRRNQRENRGGLLQEVREAIATTLPPTFAVQQLRDLFPHEEHLRLSTCLRELRLAGVVTNSGKARATLWHRVEAHAAG